MAGELGSQDLKADSPSLNHYVTDQMLSYLEPFIVFPTALKIKSNFLLWCVRTYLMWFWHDLTLPITLPLTLLQMH